MLGNISLKKYWDIFLKVSTTVIYTGSCRAHLSFKEDGFARPTLKICIIFFTFQSEAHTNERQQ